MKYIFCFLLLILSCQSNSENDQDKITSTIMNFFEYLDTSRVTNQSFLGDHIYEKDIEIAKLLRKSIPHKIHYPKAIDVKKIRTEFSTVFIRFEGAAPIELRMRKLNNKWVIHLLNKDLLVSLTNQSAEMSYQLYQYFKKHNELSLAQLFSDQALRNNHSELIYELGCAALWHHLDTLEFIEMMELSLTLNNHNAYIKLNKYFPDQYPSTNAAYIWDCEKCLQSLGTLPNECKSRCVPALEELLVTDYEVALKTKNEKLLDFTKLKEDAIGLLQLYAKQ